MTVPPEFRALTMHFHQDIDLMERSMEDTVKAALLQMGLAGAHRLRPFVADLLDGTHTADELNAVWNLGAADWYLKTSREAPALFGLILRTIDSWIAEQGAR